MPDSSEPSDGISISGKSSAIIESCTISDNERAAIVIRQMSTPYIRRCTIRDRADGYGLFVDEKGEGIIEECHISGDARSHVSIARNSTPLIRRCTIGTPVQEHADHEHDAEQPPDANPPLSSPALQATNHVPQSLSSRITAHLRRSIHSCHPTGDS
ncbi:MAG: right-handed parallel beta-helix repeat-containing protein [Chloroflexaceae bacterium]|nr:right-handed parallel beta-helix repeat-containing protein [Chloroflexaceae bacterium]